MTELKRDIQDLRGNFKHLARSTDHCVHEYAWAAVGLAVALGMCVGMLVGGSSSEND